MPEINVTRLLNAMEAGRSEAAEELFPLIYEELRSLARARLAREKPGQTLQPTALVHEAYLKLVGSPSSSWKGRTHFFAAASEAIRRILIDRARRRQTAKHGGEMTRVNRIDLDEQIAAPMRDERLLRLDTALKKLERESPLRADLVKLRFFSGLTIRETAELLGISTSSADRYWTYARAWLQREMS